MSTQTKQVAAAIETPRANDLEEAWKILVKERFTNAEFRPELRPLSSSNPTVGTLEEQRIAETSAGQPDDIAQRRIVRPVEFRRPSFHQNRGIFTTLQSWEGSVIDVGAESFTARLIDRTESRGDEEGEFSLEEVSPADRELVKPGAIFYWSVGYLDHRNGQRTRESLLRFRRLPAWSEGELAGARQRAREILTKFETDGDGIAQR